MDDVLIIGGGIGGLTLALFLHKLGIPCRVYESANTIKPLGMGINLLPYATKEFAQLGILDELCKVAIETKESVFCNRFGQIIHRRQAGKLAGYEYPQLSIHRGDLHDVLLTAVKNTIGADRLHLGWCCTDFTEHSDYVTANFIDSDGIGYLQQRGALLIGCDGVHSKVRQLLYPNDGGALFHGINMWRGVSECTPFLSGASMLRIGLPNVGKLVLYPIKNIDDKNNIQLVNWVVEIETPTKAVNNKQTGTLNDFIHYFANWKFPWLDVPSILKAHKGQILQYPMVDKDPIPQWSFGRVSLLGDAAHPMVPLGSNGAGQAILDATFLHDCIKIYGCTKIALKKYEETRLPQTKKITLIDREMLQDRLLKEAYSRTDDNPFTNVKDIFSTLELENFSEPTYNLVS